MDVILILITGSVLLACIAGVIDGPANDLERKEED